MKGCCAALQSPQAISHENFTQLCALIWLRSSHGMLNSNIRSLLYTTAIRREYPVRLHRQAKLWATSSTVSRPAHQQREQHIEPPAVRCFPATCLSWDYMEGCLPTLPVVMLSPPSQLHCAADSRVSQPEVRPQRNHPAGHEQAFSVFSRCVWCCCSGSQGGCSPSVKVAQQ